MEELTPEEEAQLEHLQEEFSNVTKGVQFQFLHHLEEMMDKLD